MPVLDAYTDSVAMGEAYEPERDGLIIVFQDGLFIICEATQNLNLFDFGYQVAHVVVKADQAFFHNLQHADAGDELGQRSHLGERVGSKGLGV